MKKLYVKKPIPIEAIQWKGNNWNEINAFCGDVAEFKTIQSPTNAYNTQSEELIIKTLEGDHIASKGDYIIKGVKGEFYPCKEDIFNETYSSVEGDIPSEDDKLKSLISEALRMFDFKSMLNREMSIVKHKLEEAQMWHEKQLSK